MHLEKERNTDWKKKLMRRASTILIQKKSRKKTTKELATNVRLHQSGAQEMHDLHECTITYIFFRR